MKCARIAGAYLDGALEGRARALAYMQDGSYRSRAALFRLFGYRAHISQVCKPECVLASGIPRRAKAELPGSSPPPSG